MFTLTPQDRSDLTTFLSRLVRTPSISCREDKVANLLVKELQKIGIQQVTIDRIGNVVAKIKGRARSSDEQRPLLLYNGHMDTVDVTDRAAWQHDPWGGAIQDGMLYGIGACDMKASIAAMVYGAKKLLEADAPFFGDLVLAFVVQEEPCEGLAMQVLVEEENIRPDWVILGEPTNLHLSRGQRGRVELKVSTRGRSSHAAQPAAGSNAISAAMRLIFGIELLTGNLANDRFLGPGSLTITQIESSAPSRNAVPDQCCFYVDRRLTLGENETRALAEIQSVIVREGVPATVEITEYQGTSYKGYACKKREVFPPWALPTEHPLVQVATNSLKKILGHRPEITSWAFSTDGVYTMGQAHIPTIGFGPGDESLAHSPNEHVLLQDVHLAAQAYAKLAVDILSPTARLDE